LAGSSAPKEGATVSGEGTRPGQKTNGLKTEQVGFGVAVNQ